MHNSSILRNFAQLLSGQIKAAAEIVKKPRTEYDDHCPHCDHKFHEKGYPRPKYKGESDEEWKAMLDSGDYDDVCPNCDGVVDRKELTDEEIKGCCWGNTDIEQQLRKSRDNYRSRKARRTQTKEASYGRLVLLGSIGTEKRASFENVPEEALRILGDCLGVGPYAKPYVPNYHECPKCHEKKAVMHEVHADTGMDDWELKCKACGQWSDVPATKSAASEIQKLLDDSDIPADVYFYTDGKDRATVCLGDWHDEVVSDIAMQFGRANWDQWEDPDDTEIGKPDWATATLNKRRKQTSKSAGIANALRRARNVTHTDPTPAQAEAGNYAKGELKIHGMTVKLENPKGTTRRGYNADGTVKWESLMTADYGYFKATKAVDGDAIDCFIGPDPESEMVVAIDQYRGNTFDETKFVLGVGSQSEGEKLYLAHYPKGWKLGPVSTATVQQLREWLKDGKHTVPFKGQLVKAASEYRQLLDDAFTRAVEQMLEGADKEMAKKGHGVAKGSCGCRVRGCRCPSSMHNISLTLDVPCEECSSEKSAVIGSYKEKDYGKLLHNLRIRRGECPVCAKPNQPPHKPCGCDPKAESQHRKSASLLRIIGGV